MRAHKTLLLLAALLGLARCGCTGNGHVVQAPFIARPTDDVVHCVCNLSFDNSACTGGKCSAHVGIGLCIPPDVRAAANADLGPTPDAGPVPDGGSLGVDHYSRVVDDYCKNVVTTTVYHLVRVWNGGWCEYKAPYAPQGGIGTSVECFAQEINDGRKDATLRDDGTCDTPCAPIVCDQPTNCKDVQDNLGNVHLDNCACNQIRDKYFCPGDNPRDLPTPVFCRPPIGTPGRQD